MIAVAIVAILSTIAYPTYQSSVLRSKRAIVKVRLMDIVERETKYYIDNRTYGDLSDLGFTADTIGINDDGDVAAGSGTYDLSVTVATAATFTVQAVAKNQMLNDSGCLTMTIDLAGTKTPLACW
jgi:type IV pilus assembly protein PilE